MKGFTDFVDDLNVELEHSRIIIRRTFMDAINLNLIKIDEDDLPHHCREEFDAINCYLVDALEALKYATHSITLLNRYYKSKDVYEARCKASYNLKGGKI